MTIVEREVESEHLARLRGRIGGGEDGGGEDGGGEDGGGIIWEPGTWLATHRARLDRGEAAWLRVLADFDRDRMWAEDGQLSCVDWLMWRTKMSRATAFDELRVAYALQGRPLVAAAFEAGLLSWSVVRAITRLQDPDPAVDAALISLAQAGTVRDLEQAIRHYQLCADQDRPPSEARRERRGIHIRRGPDGLDTAEITLDHLEMEELRQTLAAFLEHADGQVKPVDESTQRDSHGDLTPRWQRMADALVEVLRTAMAHLGWGHTEGSDRYLVHLVASAATGRVGGIDGTPLDPTEAARAMCDAATVVHVIGEEGEPLRLGRKTRRWNTAQRRAATVRDGGTCRFPGCHNTIVDLHHVRWWEHNGRTDIDNAVSLCERHHTLTHRGFAASGEANGLITFTRPDGTVLGSTSPLDRHRFTR